jgi:hypothetical protein
MTVDQLIESRLPKIKQDLGYDKRHAALGKRSLTHENVIGLGQQIVELLGDRKLHYLSLDREGNVTFNWPHLGHIDVLKPEVTVDFFTPREKHQLIIRYGSKPNSVFCILEGQPFLLDKSGLYLAVADVPYESNKANIILAGGKIQREERAPRPDWMYSALR